LQKTKKKILDKRERGTRRIAPDQGHGERPGGLSGSDKIRKRRSIWPGAKRGAVRKKNLLRLGDVKLNYAKGQLRNEAMCEFPDKGGGEKEEPSIH